MQISYLADVPHMAADLIPGLLEHWRFAFPNDTAEVRAAKFEAHENREVLPMAWIAHSGEKVFGTAALRVADLHGREDLGPWLGGVYVLPAHRRQGVATALCRVAEDRARVMGIPRLYLFTLDQESLYARMGWETIEATVWQDRPCVIMAKNLRVG